MFTNLPILTGLMQALVLAGPAPGSPGPTIEWEAPEGCPSAAKVQLQLRQALADAPQGPALGVRASVKWLRLGYWRMQMTSEQGDVGPTTGPHVEAPSCEELAEFFLHAVKELWLSRAFTPLAAAPSSTPPPKRPRPLHRLRIAAIGGYGSVPQMAVAPGGELAHAINIGQARVEWGLRFAGGAPTGAHAPADGEPAVRETARMLRGSLLLRGCGEFSRGALAFHLCAGVEGGVLRGTANGTSNHWPVLNFHAAPAMTWWVRPLVGVWFGLAAGINALLPDGCIKTAPDRSCAAGHGPAWRTPLFVAQGGLGLEFRWDRMASSRAGKREVR